MIATETARTSERRSAYRPIEGIYAAPPQHWVGDGFRVAGYTSVIPEAARKLSPFLLLDYHAPYAYAPSDRPRGVGVHPHRGFETVTLAWQGSVAHHDSTGGGGTIGPGDVQWMTAASGILHKEYHEAEFARRGGPFHMAQLWVNLPRAHKMDAPRYQPITAGRIAVVATPDGLGRVRVIAGEHAGVAGAAMTFSKVTVLDVELAATGKVELSAPARENLGLLVMSGALTLDGAQAKQGDFVVFENHGDRVLIEATADAHVLVLGGEPIEEPIVQYGPFVMNTRREIAEAFADLQAGKFGHLDD